PSLIFKMRPPSGGGGPTPRADLRSVLLNGVDETATLPTAATVFGTSTLSAFTVAYWIKQASTAIIYDGRWNFTTSASWNDGGLAYYLTTGASPQYAFGVNNWSTNRSYDIDTGANWNLVVERYLSGMTDGIRASVNNGAPTVTDTLTANVTAMTNAITVGTMPGSAGYHVNAYFCCFGFWDKYLSDAEQTSLYNSGVFNEFDNVAAANLQGYFRTDADTDVVNSGGWVDIINGNNGTWNNSPTLSTDVPPTS
ncbi:MAG: hypothetical protein KDD51_16820, partial [Bdellovibrionales bacterium]|nr:hypothetical protein [Bdellovibrionales bacterium]